jgi:hypothetical protein
MLLVIPAVQLACLALVIWTRWAKLGLRGALVVASIVTATIVSLVTEALSRIHALHDPTLRWFWVGLGALAISGLVCSRVRLVRARIARPHGADLIFLAFVGALLAATLAMAAISPPNAIDALTYHLPRVMQWRQNHTLAFFPTSFQPQLYHPPFAEVVMLHVWALTGGDQWLNLVGWLAYVGVVLSAGLLARELAADRSQQVLAMLVCATIPIAVVQGSGPKNDIMVSYWLASAVWLILRGGRRPGVWSSVLAGCALGLALYTKSNAALFGGPVLSALFLARLSADPRAFAALARSAVLVVGVAAAIYSPLASRNLELYGNVVGPGQDGPDRSFAFRTSVVSGPHLISNVTRAFAVQLGTPWHDLNEVLAEHVRILHRWIGVDPSDTRTTLGNDDFHVPDIATLDDATSSPLHAMLIAVAGLFMLFRPWKGLGMTHRALASGLTLGFLAFCALVTWQTSAARYQAPVVVLWSALVAGMLSQWPLLVRRTMVISLCGFAIYMVLFNGARPLLGKDSIPAHDRFTNLMARRSDVAQGYIDATRLVRERDCAEVGLAVQWFEAEYALWELLPSARSDGHIDHVIVHNQSGRLQPPRRNLSQPCAVISTGPSTAEHLIVRGQHYDPVWQGKNIWVYLPSGSETAIQVPYVARYESDAPERWRPDERRRYSVTVTNAGTAPWIARRFALGVHFGSDDDEPQQDWATNQRFPLPRDLPPGDLMTFNVEIRAPERSGSYILRHRMTNVDAFWFDQIDKRSVEVRR